VIVDADNDGRDDVALYFSADAVRALLSPPVEGNDNYTELGVQRWQEPEVIGLHFEAPDGTELMAENIFALGEPVSITPGSQVGTIVSSTTVRPEPRTWVYPNPFNPSTTIGFELAMPERVTVRIFDVAGRLVKTLADRVLAAGPHELRWDGRDERGFVVASGIYFVHFESRNGVTTRKAIMLK
jgi:hypothetical protein